MLGTCSTLQMALAVLLLAGSAGGARAEEDPEVQQIKQTVATAAGISRGSLNPARRGMLLPSKARILVIPVNDSNTRWGMIDNWQAEFVERRLKRASDEKFDLVVLEIETNGGFIDSCERINAAIAACKVPVVAYVKNRAFSGGALISLGCKMIVMTPGSQIGGAKAVSPFGDIPDGQRQKADSMLRAMVIALSNKNNYPPAIAVGMVHSEAEVWETNDPLQRFMVLEDLEAAERGSVKPERLKQWKFKNTILTLESKEAVSAGLASGVVSDFDELWVGLGLGQPEVTLAKLTMSERLARLLINPIWRVLLVLIGVIALIWELKSPGHGVGYLVFALSLGVFFWLQVFAESAGLLEILMFGIGAVLIAIEIFFIAGFGVLGFCGFAMVLVSIVLAFLPRGGLTKWIEGTASQSDMTVLTYSMLYALLTVFLLVGGVIYGLLRGARVPGMSRLALKTEIVGSPVLAGMAGTMLAPNDARAALVGSIVKAETILRPAGKVRAGEHTYDAVTDGGFIEAGRDVKVVRVTVQALVVREPETNT